MTTGLVSTSAVVLLAFVLFLASVRTPELPSLLKVAIGIVFLAAALLAGGLWWKRINHRRTWLSDATAKWLSVMVEK
ncbi:hypothetical protein [Pseudarthrobacter sp. CC4]|uniref:hypothetical protein n=1 Tax=Pseudarthrobacter sp. CC4 TaxID=3029190 RepID=UPI003BA1F012